MRAVTVSLQKRESSGSEVGHKAPTEEEVSTDQERSIKIRA